MLALAGLPGTVGFMGKLFLIEAAVAGDYTWLGIVIVIGSMISLAYYLRVIAADLDAPGARASPPRSPAPPPRPTTPRPRSRTAPARSPAGPSPAPRAAAAAGSSSARSC